MARFARSLVFTVFVYRRHLNADEVNVDKRILLNDPDLLHTQVHAIQQDLERVKTQLTNRIVAQQAEIDFLKGIINNQHSTQGNILIRVN